MKMTFVYERYIQQQHNNESPVVYLPKLAMQVAGRWKSSQMPAHYAKAELAERSAIATALISFSTGLQNFVNRYLIAKIIVNIRSNKYRFPLRFHSPN